MSYIDKNLASGEVVLYRTRLHWIVMVWPVLIGLFCGFAAILMMVVAITAAHDGGSGASMGLGLACAFLGALAVAFGIMRRSATEMAVTNRRVIMKSGLVSRRTVELMLQKVESIGVDQGIFGRLTGYGSIIVRGTGGTAEHFDRVAHPLEFRRQVQEQIDKSLAVAPEARREHGVGDAR